MKKFRNIRRRFRRSVRAVSPVIAVLLMIVIAVAAALFAYSWTMGYLDFLTVKADQGVQIQAINWDGTTVRAYVQNVGPANLTISNLYINDNLDTAFTPMTLGAGETKEVSSTGLYDPELDGSHVTVKVTTGDGNIFMLKKTVTSATGGGPTPAILYRKPITITGVVGTHSNFPVLVTISGDTEIGGSTGASGGSADGDHVYFTDTNGTKLAHEIESWTGGGGSPASLVAWVRVPTLTASPYTIYIYYGSDVPGGQENPTGVWDSNYKGVWHLKETGTGTADEYKDSTGAHNGQGGSGQVPTLTSSVTTNGAQDFTSDYINVGGETTLKIQNTITLEALVKIDSTPGWCMIIARQDGSVSGDAYLLAISNDNKALMSVKGGTGAYSGTLTMSTWYHLVGVAGPSGITIYVNGAPAGSTSGISSWTIDDNPVFIGAGENPDPSEYFDGIIDEARISNTVRSADWIQTEYANINTPATISGAEEEV